MGLEMLASCLKTIGSHVTVFMGGFGGEKEAGKVTDFAWGNLCFLASYGQGDCGQGDCILIDMVKWIPICKVWSSETSNSPGECKCTILSSG